MLSTIGYLEKQEKGWFLLVVSKVRESVNDVSANQGKGMKKKLTWTSPNLPC